MGNVYYTKFTANPANFLKEKDARYTLNDKMYNYPVSRGGITAWMPGEDGTIAAVRRWMKKNNILFTRYAYKQQGGLFDQQILKKGKGQVPIKSDGSPIGNIDKYGGYNNATVSYFMYVQAEEKGKPVYLFVPVLLYRAEQLKTDEDRRVYCLEEWQREGKKYTRPEILLKEIKYNAMLELNGFRMHISSRSNSYIYMKNAMELCLSDEQAGLIKRIGKFLEKQKNEKDAVITDWDKINKEQTLLLYDAFVAKLTVGIYKEKMGKQAKMLQECRGHFLNISVELQCKVLMEILHLFQCNVVLTNLTEIQGKKKTGTIAIPFDVTKLSQLILVNQSITGFFEKKIQLVPFEKP